MPITLQTYYCAISINSAGHVTCYMPAEILNSAHGGNDRYIPFFRQIFRISLRFLKPFSQVLFMVSALGQNGRYNRYISAFLERLLCVTDELIEMAQYILKRLVLDPRECLRMFVFVSTYSMCLGIFVCWVLLVNRPYYKHVVQHI